MHRRHLFGLGLLLMFLTACRSERPPQLSDLPAALDTWTLTPIATLGEETDSVVFGWIEQVVVDRRDRIWVADRDAGEIYVFTADGTWQHRWGGKGEGPGEFQGLLSLALGPGDSLYTWDWQAGRVQVFTFENGFVRAFRPDWQAPGQPGVLSQFGLRLVGVVPEGMLLQYLPPLRSFEELAAPRPVLVLYASWNGQVQDTLLQQEIHPPLVHRLSSGAIAVSEPPFAWQPVIRADQRGFLWYGRTDSLKIERIDWQQKQRVVVVQYQVPRVPVTEADRDSLLQGETLALLIRETGYKLPAFKPVFTTFALGPDETIWVRLSPPHGVSEAHWLIFNAQGHLLADTYLPVDVEELAVGTRIVAGRTRDRTRVLLFRRPTGAV
ncbi:6-bladed beta-propeller [Rhodothermus profundi]|uniref:6-bladed beta-propeller protein n=1 Tax=Rhodothermus profundi TaxID=633813 RepID=A0A1M6SW87_9BACT|nr:6-bladed beta-propeller [Rhodothermus profundi]SHK48975.1 hypothetical protein SAMN04488087_1253 [Rhodothermus profundi]